MTKFKGLGRGLDALLSAAKVDLDPKKILDNPELNKNKLQELKISQIKPGKYQPRRIFNEIELNELASSIKINGVIQPIVVRQVSINQYEIIAGERRWRASQIAGLKLIPALIREFNDEEALAISLIENIQRRDLNIIEEAEGYRRLIDEFGLTHESLANVTGKSRSNISNTLRLLNLKDSVRDLLIDGKLDMGHARALLPLPEIEQTALATEIVNKKLTTLQVEGRVAQILYKSNNDKVILGKDPDIERLENNIANKLGMMVNIRHNRAGNGKIIINYSSLDELDNLLVYFK